MAQMTYLEIVNRAIGESKVSLDSLTSVNFASPPRTILYSHFKNWVNDVYEELLEDRPEWFFRVERASVAIWPRLYLGDVALPISVGDILEGQSSGVIFTVTGVHTSEEAEQNLEDEITLSVSFASGSNPENLILRESFDRTSPTADVDIAYFQDLGRYDFAELVAGLDEIDPDSVEVHYTPDDPSSVSGTFIDNRYPVKHIPFYNWPTEYDLYPWSGQFPQFIAETPQGSWSLYPQPEDQMFLSFDYTQSVAPLVAHDDVPQSLPARFHMYLMWRVVQEFADFDSNGGLFRRAQKHVEKYRNYLERDEMQEVRIEQSRFYR